jgi:protease-4
MVDVLKAQLDKAAEDHRVKAVILKVDSPGGEVLASDEIANALERFQEESDKPIVVSMGSLAASGGYYVSAPCRWIVANELTITGSIGVIMEAWNYRGLMTKVGLKPFVFKSGEHKDMLSGSRDLVEIPEDEQKMVQDLIDQAYGKFKRVVSEGRDHASKQNEDEGKALSDNWETFADGRVLSGKEAYDLGFVDQLGNFDDAVERAKDIADVRSANLIEYHQRHDIGDILGLFGESGSRVVKVDLGVEMPRLQAGHFYYIWPTYLR